MEAALIYKSLFPEKSFQEISAIFFAEFTPQSTHFMFLKIFQCWGINECKLRAEISDEEIAQFLDRLTDLVASAYIVHQGNGVLTAQQEGNSHD
ncbi:MAG: hypothetical protein V4577_08475 [Bacteroidota bacterium]